MVVLADGNLDVHESQLMRRLAGLLFVDDVESDRRHSVRVTASVLPDSGL